MTKGKNNRLPKADKKAAKREIQIDQGNVGSLQVQLLNSINETLLELLKLAKEG